MALAGLQSLGFLGALAYSMTACSFHASGVPYVPDGGEIDSSHETDAGTILPPDFLRPSEGLALPPTRAYLLWRPGTVPAGRTLMGHEICRTTGDVSAIDEVNECPNSAMMGADHAVVDPLTPNTLYFLKVRDRYDQGLTSEWSAIRSFSTDDSLVAWWRMNGNATDSGTAGLDGALQNGAGFAAGIDGQALRGDGINDYADMGNHAGLHLNGPLTVSAWVNGNGAPTSADSGILNLGSLNYALTHHTDGRVYFYVNDGGNNLNVSMTSDAWHHVAGVFDGTMNAGGMKLYLDNVLAGMKASASTTTGATGDLWIGRYNLSYYRGLIDNVTLYNRVLSEAAVQNEYCATQASGGVDPLPAPCQP